MFLFVFIVKHLLEVNSFVRILEVYIHDSTCKW